MNYLMGYFSTITTLLTSIQGTHYSMNGSGASHVEEVCVVSLGGDLFKDVSVERTFFSFPPFELPTK